MSKLTTIANEMQTQIATGRCSAVHRPLPHGLHLVMQRNGRQWRLALGRETVFPSDVEVTICRTAFNVPEETPEERVKRFHVHPKTRRYIRYHVVEMHWHEEPAPVAA